MSVEGGAPKLPADGSKQEATKPIPIKSETVAISVPGASGHLLGSLKVPEGAIGVVLFAHGSGSGRLSPRNQGVAATLNVNRIATLLVDLLTSKEEEVDILTTKCMTDRMNPASISRMMQLERLIAIMQWQSSQPALTKLKFGLFGASTGGGAALLAAASKSESISAVVSRGGRPDLCPEEKLAEVRAPTLLIVGGRDEEVLTMNQSAYQKLKSLKENETKSLVVVPGATHLFEEEGTLEQVATSATQWFVKWLK